MLLMFLVGDFGNKGMNIKVLRAINTNASFQGGYIDIKSNLELYFLHFLHTYTKNKTKHLWKQKRMSTTLAFSGPGARGLKQTET